MRLLEDGPKRARRRLLLAHGAGAPMDSPFMNDVATGVAEQGIRVLRFEFPYMSARRRDGKRRSPDRKQVLIDTFREAIAAAGGPRDLCIGGKSMGGRYATMIADEAGVSGIVCLGYPFHAPGKPDKPRTEHLRDLATPALFVQGTRDPMGSRDEVERYRLSKTIELCWLEDGDHSFKPRKLSGRTLEQAIDEAIAATARFIEGT